MRSNEKNGRLRKLLGKRRERMMLGSGVTPTITGSVASLSARGSSPAATSTSTIPQPPPVQQGLRIGGEPTTSTIPD